MSMPFEPEGIDALDESLLETMDQEELSDFREKLQETVDEMESFPPDPVKNPSRSENNRCRQGGENHPPPYQRRALGSIRTACLVARKAFTDLAAKPDAFHDQADTGGVKPDGCDDGFFLFRK